MDSGREHLLGIALVDHAIVEDLGYLLRSPDAVSRLHQRRLVLLADAVNAKFDAFVADEDLTILGPRARRFRNRARRSDAPRQRSRNGDIQKSQPCSAKVQPRFALPVSRANASAIEDLRVAGQAHLASLRIGVRAGNVIDRTRALIKKAPPRKDSLDVNSTVLEVAALTSGEMSKNGVSVQTRLAESLPTVQGDRVQIQQVLLNLFVNAAEAMSGTSEGPKELLISTGTCGSEGVLVAVRDSGPGLTIENTERLFDAFDTTKTSGLGMRLSICRSVIEAYQGQLWATANVPRGAVFQFTLPVYS